MNIHPKIFEKNSPEWIGDLIERLSSNGFGYDFDCENDLNLIFIKECHLVLNLININTSYTPEELIILQQKFYNKNLSLIHLWEDVFCSKPNQIIERIKSLAGKNIRVHGRKTEVFKITKPEADSFLNANHLQGTVSSRYKFGLFFNDELVAVATFSALRKMNHSENYKSIELIRFAVKAGFSISGGLSKLIAYVRKNIKPDDVMSYADRDWSAGAAYLKLGFEQISKTQPQIFEIDENFNRSLIRTSDLTSNRKVFNTGSIKFILTF